MNFDEYIDRNNYPTMKWSDAYLIDFFGNPSAIPMSVADMDLKAPLSVIEHLLKAFRQGSDHEISDEKPDRLAKNLYS